MTDVACVKSIYQAIDISIYSFFSFGGGSEMMRDGDVIGLLPMLERGYKYGSEIFDWLVSCMVD